MGFFAPARTPAAVADKLVAALREITQSTELRTKLLDMGFEPFGGTADAFASDIKSQYPVWAGLVKAAGVMPE
jgi:tripartite-type tricarboxylate transporter receptor subunit TctC